MLQHELALRYLRAELVGLLVVAFTSSLSTIIPFGTAQLACSVPSAVSCSAVFRCSLRAIRAPKAEGVME